LSTVAIRLATDSDARTGTYHFSNAGSTNWAEFADAIFEGAVRRGHTAVSVQPIATADYPTPAQRPTNSLLSHEAISRDFGIVPRDWRAALEDILDELIGKVV
jgi:dTDP-4-dehydrorhamnose reductase